MAAPQNPKFKDGQIKYLSLNQASTLPPFLNGELLSSNFYAAKPAELIEILGAEDSDDWIEWLALSHPIVLVEKGGKAQTSRKSYYRILGHDTFNYLGQYLSQKYGSDSLNDYLIPMIVLPRKQLSKFKTNILNNELVFSYLLKKPSGNASQISEYVFQSPSPLPQLNSVSRLSKFARVSRNSVSGKRS